MGAWLKRIRLPKRGILAVVGIWLAWVVILIGFQAGVVSNRFRLHPPDDVLPWTASMTLPNSQADKPTLMDPFLNTQVSWDSEFYLSIALHGYDDPRVRVVRVGNGQSLSLNYAFFPLYPLLIRLLAFPLRVFELDPIATATLAGVLVSVVGALAACLALYDLTRDELGHESGLRAAFYLLIFPTGFFLAQVYTEGLFLGITFVCLALARRSKWLPAAVLAALSVWVRAGGVLLVVPLAWAWLHGRPWLGWRDRPWPVASGLLALFAPLLSYLAWTQTPLAKAFNIVESQYFSRVLNAGHAIQFWNQAVHSLSGRNPETVVYYGIEFGVIILFVIASLAALRRYPDLVLFGLSVAGLAFLSGPAQGMSRYLLEAPAIFLSLARWGRSPVFDRAWTILSLLGMGMEATLFSFDFWVG